MKNMIFLFLSVIIFLSACNSPIHTNMSEEIVDFQFTSQDQKIISLEDLKGDYWIANFMYTSCTTICPRTTANMVQVQNRLNKDGLKPQIVSFSVNPNHDTPALLKSYADENEVDLKTWDFLTGYDFETIKNMSEKSFKTVLSKGVGNQRAHGYSFYLVDPEGVIVKKYDGMSEGALEEMIGDIHKIS